MIISKTPLQACGVRLAKSVISYNKFLNTIYNNITTIDH
ncbi:hypothetical protein rpr22_CDSx177 [Rickettsia prowazekii str. Rp22]|uniref:Uncharacterized protein n=1 Tax=Rickettsia prowazekii (strain Rp22) TaxID=449216 RepID=D5AW92_RICPP|nr:hypothetical protein rpr22_CDSx177 [Rickettsia prowazekii str. Rp22]